MCKSRLLTTLWRLWPSMARYRAALSYLCLLFPKFVSWMFFGIIGVLVKSMRPSYFPFHSGRNIWIERHNLRTSDSGFGNTFFWVVTPNISVEIHRRLGGSHSLHFPDEGVRLLRSPAWHLFISGLSLTLKTEAISSSATSVHFTN